MLLFALDLSGVASAVAMPNAERKILPHGAVSVDNLRYLLLKRRVRAFRSGALLSLPASIGAVAVVLITFYRAVPAGLLIGWVAGLALMIAISAVIDRRSDCENGELAELQRYWRNLMRLQFFGSFMWMLLFPFLAIFAGGLGIAVIGVVGTAILCGVLMVHRTAPRAGRFHIFVIAPSLAFSAYVLGGAGSWPIIMLFGLFAIALMGAIEVQERQFVRIIAAEVERQEASETVALLLNDYEEQSADWLWTVGPNGNVRNVAARFADALDMAAEDIEGTSLISLFPPSQERDVLERHVLERSPFRDLVLPVAARGETAYWRLSASPRKDGRMSGVARDVTADRKVEERVVHMAHYDNLTGLANRYLFNERLRQLLSGDQNTGASVALFYLDLDDFKSINDTRGHVVGDRLLNEVGHRLARVVRGDDLVARLGGDEFAILIETRAGAGMLIERGHRFLSAVREPYEIDGQSYTVSTSLGVAQSSDGDCDPEELMRRADLALYAAKNKGRDSLALFEPDLDTAARERRRIETDLREALAHNQLRIYFQPFVNLETGETTGFEALVRWEHPQRGLVPPNDFLSIAEETGMINAIGDWVIDHTLDEVANWPGDCRIAINLSPTQVKNPSLVNTVAQAIDRTNIAPDRIELEITEHVLMDQWDVSQATLMRLRDLGVRIAIDDFGTGYSSLGYLRRFPFDRLKIDRVFVKDIVADVGSQAIVSTITRLADAMGMDTTAEGVEDREQLDILRRLGVGEVQGYLIARPLPADEIKERQGGEGPECGSPPAGGADAGGAVVDYHQARKDVLRRREGKRG